MQACWLKSYYEGKWGESVHLPRHNLNLSSQITVVSTPEASGESQTWMGTNRVQLPQNPEITLGIQNPWTLNRTHPLGQPRAHTPHRLLSLDSRHLQCPKQSSRPLWSLAEEGCQTPANRTGKENEPGVVAFAPLRMEHLRLGRGRGRSL